MKKVLAMLLAAVLLAGMVSGCTVGDAVLTGTVAEIDEDGNVYLDGISLDDVANAGIEAGDMVRLSVNDKTWDMVFAGNIGDSASKMFEPALAFEGDTAAVFIKYRNCAETLGVSADSKTMVEIVLLEPNGLSGWYQVLYTEFCDERSNDRNEFDSDAQFANFRELAFGGIAPHTIYRSSTPVSPELGRASYADGLIENVGIQTVVNLKDSSEDVEAFMDEAGFDSPYYKSLYDSGHVLTLDIGKDFSSADYKDKLKRGIEFMLANEGPYLIHCAEGKSRTGFVIFVLEAFMGAGLEDIHDDYLESWVNFYHYTEESEAYKDIWKMRGGQIVTYLTGQEDYGKVSVGQLQAASASYLLDCGLTEVQLTELRALLSGN